MTYSNEFLLSLLLVLPALTGVFIVVIPRFDVSSIRLIVTTVLLAWLGILLKCGSEIYYNQKNMVMALNFGVWFEDNQTFTLFLGMTQFLLLLAIILSLLSTFFLNHRVIEANGVIFSSFSLFLLTLSTLAILTTSKPAALITANICIILFLFLVAHYGGTQKGKALYVTTIFFLTVDLASIISLLLPKAIWGNYYPYLFWVLFAPALARLLIPFFAPFARALFKKCPSDMILLFISFIMPVGASLLISLSQTPVFIGFDLNENIIITVFIFASLLFSAFWTILEKDPRQIGINLLVFYNAIFVALILKLPVQQSVSLGATLFFCGILSSTFTLYTGNLIFQEKRQHAELFTVNKLWLGSLVLWLGIPGIGIGTSLWKSLMRIFTSGSATSTFSLFFWLFIFLVFTGALVQNYCRYLESPKKISSLIPQSSEILFSSKVSWFAYCVVLVLCYLISTFSLVPGA